jgi:hypothetical protein
MLIAVTAEQSTDESSSAKSLFLFGIIEVPRPIFELGGSAFTGDFLGVHFED